MRLGSGSVFKTARGRRNGKKAVKLFCLLLFFFALVILYFYLIKNFVPQLGRVAENNAKVIAINASNNAVFEVFDELDTAYTDLFSFTKNEEGRVLAMTSDMINVNRIKSTVAVRVQEKISSIDETELKIPLGTLMGSNVLAGAGPKIGFKLMPVGAAVVDIVSEFSEAGINQTRLVITLKINTDIALLMPGYRRIAKVCCDVPVIDTVIVGEIPSSYVNVDRDGYDFEDDVLQLAEN